MCHRVNQQNHIYHRIIIRSTEIKKYPQKRKKKYYKNIVIGENNNKNEIRVTIRIHILADYSLVIMIAMIATVAMMIAMDIYSSDNVTR